MKNFALIPRRPDHTRTQFRDHYENVHAPLAMATVMEGVTRYIRNHIARELYGAADFDVVSGFWFRTAEAGRALYERFQGPQAERIVADEKRFMDRPSARIYAVEEDTILGAENPRADLLLMALLGAPEDEAHEDFVRDFERRALPALLDATRAPVWCLQNRVRTTVEGAPIFDFITQVHADGDAGLADWAREEQKRAGRVLLLQVETCETEIPAG